MLHETYLFTISFSISSLNITKNIHLLPIEHSLQHIAVITEHNMPPTHIRVIRSPQLLIHPPAVLLTYIYTIKSANEPESVPHCASQHAVSTPRTSTRTAIGPSTRSTSRSDEIHFNLLILQAMWVAVVLSWIVSFLISIIYIICYLALQLYKTIFVTVHIDKKLALSGRKLS